MPAILPPITLKIGSLVQIHGHHFYEFADFFLTAMVTKIEEPFSEGWQCVFVEIVGGNAVTCNPIFDATPSGAWVYPQACWPLCN
jgi:hypothetical protein